MSINWSRLCTHLSFWIPFSIWILTLGILTVICNYSGMGCQFLTIFFIWPVILFSILILILAILLSVVSMVNAITDALRSLSSQSCRSCDRDNYESVSLKDDVDPILMNV